MAEAPVRAVSFVERVVVTIAAPVIVVLVGRAPLPSVSAPVGLDVRVSPVWLGLTPFLTAYGIVELVALCVPKWRRARHVAPLRPRLEVASTLLAFAIAVVQAWGIVMTLEQTDLVAGLAGRATAAATLVGGSCLLAILARWVTRRGLLNGFVLLWALDVLQGTFRGHLLQQPASAGGTRAVIVGLVAIAAVVAATRVAVGVRKHGVVPIPASSILPVSLAWSLVLLPRTLANLHVPYFGALADWLEQDGVYVLFALTLGMTFAAAPLMHRVDEMAALFARLGANVDAAGAAGALWGSMPPTIAYVALLAVAEVAAVRAHTPASMVTIALVAAAAFDLLASVRMHARVGARLVAIGVERRAFAVGPLCAALERAGVVAWARGTGALSLLQAFGPYAPAEIFVREADAARATETLDRLAAAPETHAPAPASAGAVAAPVPIPHTIALAVLLAFTVAAWRTPLQPDLPPMQPMAHRAKLEIVRVDENADPFYDEHDVPGALPEGVALRDEAFPSRGRVRQYVRVVKREGESLDDTWDRVRGWIEKHPLPAGDRWAWQAIDETHDDATREWHEVGLRTLVLEGRAFVTTDDIASVRVRDDSMDEWTSYSVEVVLVPSAAQRFEDVTAEWVDKRLAILVDDRVDSAPVVKQKIGGGRISITMGSGSPERQLADARRLAASLGGE